MLTPYRRILAQPGAARFSAAAFVCRTPLSMVALGTVLLVEARTGSYAVAGAVSATGGLAGAAGAAVQGRLADRFGQHRVLPGAAVVFGAGLVLLAWATWAGYVLPGAYLGAAVTGMGLPQAGSMVRARWRHVLRDGGGSLQTAFAFEAVADEVIFILGPVAVVALATGWHPVAALAVPGVLGTVGAVLLAVQRGTQPPLHVTTRVSGPGQPLGWGRLAPIVVAYAGIGCILGATEVVTVAFTDHLGQPRAAALLLSLWAVGSLVAGTFVGSFGGGWAPLRLFRLASLALGLSLLPMLVVQHVWVAALVLLASGLAISPALVASASLVERVVPAARMTEGIAWTTTGLALGLALGAAVSGGVVDEHGARAGFLVPLTAGLLATAAALLTRDPGARADGAVDGGPTSSPPPPDA